MENMDYKKVASRIKELRLNKIEEDKKNRSNWSLKSLASRIGTSAQRLNLIENGNTKKPSAEILYNLAYELSTTYEYILFGREDELGVISLEIPIHKNKIKNGTIKINVKNVVNS